MREMSCQNCPPCSNPEQEQSLLSIGIINFVVVELTEYLDTHPWDKEAINYFNYYVQVQNKMTAEFAAKYYPLNIATAYSQNREWNWGLAPLPWEGV